VEVVSALVSIGTALTSPEYKCWIENTANGTKLSNEVTVIGKIDNEPPYITYVTVPDGATRDKHSTAIEFTIRDDDSGLWIWLDGMQTSPKCYVEFNVYNYHNVAVPYTMGGARETGWVRKNLNISSADAKGKTFKFNFTNINTIGPANAKLDIVLYDKAGNEYKQRLTSQPTIPGELAHEAESKPNSGDYVKRRIYITNK